MLANQNEFYLRSSTASPIKKAYVSRVEDVRATTTAHTLRNNEGAGNDSMYATPEDNESNFASLAYKPVKHDAFDNKPVSRSKKDREQRDILKQRSESEQKQLLKQQQRQQHHMYLEHEQLIQMHRQEAAVKQRQKQAIEGEQMYERMMKLALQQNGECIDAHHGDNNAKNIKEKTQRREKSKKEEDGVEAPVLFNNKKLDRPQSRKLYLGTSAGSTRESSNPATTDVNDVRTYYYGQDAKKDDMLSDSNNNDYTSATTFATGNSSKPGTANKRLVRPSKSAGAVRKNKNKPTLQRMSSFSGFGEADTSDKDDDASVTVDGRPPSRQSSAFPFHLSQSNGEQTPPNETAVPIEKMDRIVYSPLINVGRSGLLNTNSRSDLDDSQNSDMKPVDLVDLDSDDEIFQTKPKSRQSKTTGKAMMRVVGDEYNNGSSLLNSATNNETIGQRGGTSHSSSTNTTELTSSSSDLGNSGLINQNLHIAADENNNNNDDNNVIRHWIVGQPSITPSNVSKDLVKDGFFQFTPPSTADRNKVPFKIHVTYSNRHSSGKKGNKSKSRGAEADTKGQHAQKNMTHSNQMMEGRGSTKDLLAVHSIPFEEKMVPELREAKTASYTNRIVDKTIGKNSTINGNITTIPNNTNNNNVIKNTHAHGDQETPRVLLQSNSMVNKSHVDRNEDATDIEDDFIVVSYDDDDDDIIDDDDGADDEFLSDINHEESRMFNARVNKHGEVNAVFRAGYLDENGREEIIDLENLDLSGEDFVSSLEDDFLSLFHT